MIPLLLWSVVAALGAIDAQTPYLENVPVLERRFSSKDEPAAAVAHACNEWLKEATAQYQAKGLLILQSGCARNTIIAPPQVLYHGVVKFIR